MDKRLFIRVIWGIIFLTSVSLMLVMLSQNIIKLMSNSSNVNFEVDYVNTLPFPAVTVCSENNYRLVVLPCFRNCNRQREWKGVKVITLLRTDATINNQLSILTLS
jgi:Amiloride-sensitive sodium channel